MHVFKHIYTLLQTPMTQLNVMANMHTYTLIHEPCMWYIGRESANTLDTWLSAVLHVLLLAINNSSTVLDQELVVPVIIQNCVAPNLLSHSLQLYVGGVC